MTRHVASMPDQYFDELYRASPDPWAFASSEYERDKYAATLAALADGRFRRACEVGCSIGVFTRMLAPRCDSVLAIDVAPAALRQARLVCAGLTQPRFCRMRIPDQWPRGRFDLMLFSEVLYYLSPADIRRTAVRAIGSLDPGGRAMLVHWTGETDYPCTGDEAAELFIATADPALHVVGHQRRPEYRLDLLACDRGVAAAQ